MACTKTWKKQNREVETVAGILHQERLEDVRPGSGYSSQCSYNVPRLFGSWHTAVGHAQMAKVQLEFANLESSSYFKWFQTFSVYPIISPSGWITLHRKTTPLLTPLLTPRNLCHELGQVAYVFSDKTGTLTQNVMELKQLSIAGREIMNKWTVYTQEFVRKLINKIQQTYPLHTVLKFLVISSRDPRRWSFFLPWAQAWSMARRERSRFLEFAEVEKWPWELNITK